MKNLAQVKNDLIDTISREFTGDHLTMEEQRQFATQRLEEVLQTIEIDLQPELRDRFQDELLDELAGYGPIQPLLNDPEINEVMVMGPKQVYIERDGKLFDTHVVFENRRHSRSRLQICNNRRI